MLTLFFDGSENGKFPAILIAGTHGGVGKTTVATGIMAAFHKRGLRVQGFKVGPDFIDPVFHQTETGRPSLNLDDRMLPREINLGTFSRATTDTDVAVIEGVMGLFDGKSAASLSGTTAEMAIWLDAPVVPVSEAAAMAGSAAAIVHSFDTLIPELRLSAVVCNKVASEKLGYIEIEGGEAASLPLGERALGHEFRYSEIDPMPQTICRGYPRAGRRLSGKVCLRQLRSSALSVIPGFAEGSSPPVLSGAR